MQNFATVSRAQDRARITRLAAKANPADPKAQTAAKAARTRFENLIDAMTIAQIDAYREYRREQYAAAAQAS